MSKKKKSSPSGLVAPPSFEESLEQLETIVRELEGGQLPLDDSLEQYELGVRHLGLCYKTLARVEKKVEVLSRLDAQGRPLTEPFDEEACKSGNMVPSKKRPSVVKKKATRSGHDPTRSPARKKPSTSSSQSNVDEGGTLF